MQDLIDTLKSFARAGVNPTTLGDLDTQEVSTLLKAVRVDRDPAARTVENWLEGEVSNRYGGEVQDHTRQQTFFDDTRFHSQLSEPVAKSQIVRDEISSQLSQAKLGDIVIFQKASSLGLYSPTERMVIESVDGTTGDVSGRLLNGQTDRVGVHTPLRRLEVQQTSDAFDSYRNPDRIGGFATSLDTSREFHL